MGTKTTMVLALLSIASSLLVLVGYASSTLHKARRSGNFRLRLQRLGLWQSLQFWICVSDSALLLAVTPLFVYYFYHRNQAESIWEVALGRPASTFASTTLLVVRPVLIAALAGSNYLRTSSKKSCTVPLLVAAAAIVAAVATATAVRCSSRSSTASSCAAVPSNKIIVIAIEFAFASLATLVLIANRTLPKSRQAQILRQQQQQYRPSTTTSRAPSLSLLIHTQPDPWTRHIDLDLPNHDDQQHDPVKTDFGPPIRKARKRSWNDDIDYGPNMVSGLLDDLAATTDRMTDGATTSLGYVSAVTSSANPYHVGSTFSLASRDALGGFASSRVDVVASRAGSGRKYQTSTSKGSSSPNDFEPLSGTSSRPTSVAKVEKTSRTSSHTAKPPSRTQTGSNLASGLLASQINESWTIPVRLIAVVGSLWCPVALSTTSLLMSGQTGQSHILLASFCSPAAVLLFLELAMHFVTRNIRHHGTAPHPASNTTRRTSEEVKACSQRASIASSAVIVYENHDSLRSRRPHLRSYSCPLESEINGYSNPFLDSEATGNARHPKKRQSLSSAKSVPYLSQHWAAGKVKGDRVVAPRSSFVRGLNLMMNPRPKLEILPAHSQASMHKYRDYGDREGGQRASVLPASVTSAIVEGLLEMPRNQEHITTDSERTCITQNLSQERTYAASTVMSWQPEEETGEAVSVHLDRSAENTGERSTDVILDMDDTPGSPRRADTYNISVDPSLQSPTKRRVLAPPPTCSPEVAAATTSFSHNDDSQVMGSSASRLFTEIMEMVRGKGSGHGRMSDQPSGLFRGNSLSRTPPKGYASIDERTTLEQVSIYNSANEEGETMIVHPDDTSCDFQTAASQGATFTSPIDAGPEQGGMETVEATRSGRVQHECELTRKGSASSTLSFSSISSRIRSIGRSSLAGSFGSPSATPRSTGGQQAELKKMRSRTFASAFGIELGLLSRSGSRSRRDTPGSQVESSPSTSSGTCPSSLMDLSFSPSPAPARQGGPSPGDSGSAEDLEYRVRLHRRNQSRADSIMDMLDEEHGDTIEEMLDPTDEDANLVMDAAGSGGSREVDFVARLGCTKEEGENVGPDGAELDDLCEVDLADMTMNDVWERCFPAAECDEEADGSCDRQHIEAEGASGDEDLDSVMGLEMMRLARAPLLDTVEEESEGETEAGDRMHSSRLPNIDRTSLDDDDHITRRSDATRADGAHSGKADSDELRDNIEVEGRASRESLLLEREAKQRQVTELLAEHEILFPHKTLSQIVEVTEMPTGSRVSGYRTSSGASGSKLSRERMSSTTDSSAIHLGLPLSLRYQQDITSRDDTAQMTDWTSGTAAGEEAVEEQEKSKDCDVSEDSGSFRARQLAFVTPRSRMRCRVAATRKFFKDETLSPVGSTRSEAGVDPSPRSVSVRLGQLGMDQGIWARSPIKLELEGSTASLAGSGGTQDESNSREADQDGSFQIIDPDSSRSRRLRRSVTMSKGKLASESKGAIMRKLVGLDHQDSPKREQRNRLARISNGYRGPAQPPAASSRIREAVGLNQEALSSCAGQSQSPAHEKRLLHKPIKKRRKSRMKGVAVMIARHQFTVVDEDDSLIQRLNSAHQQPTATTSSSSNLTKA